MMKFARRLVAVLIFVGLIAFLWTRLISPTQTSRSVSSSASLASEKENEATVPTRQAAKPPVREASLRAVAAAAVSDGQASTSPNKEDQAFAQLQSESKMPWSLRRDDFSPRIRTLALGEWAARGSTPRASADDFVRTYGEALFGVDPSRVQFDREEVTDRTRVTYKEVVNGLPVYGGTLNLFFENGALTRVQNDMSGSQAPTEPLPSSFTATQAFEAYRDSRSADTNVTLKDSGTSRTVLYRTAAGKLVYAYEFTTIETSKANPDGNKAAFRVLYDAADPHVIKRWSVQLQ